MELYLLLPGQEEAQHVQRGKENEDKAEGDFYLDVKKLDFDGVTWGILG